MKISPVLSLVLALSSPAFAARGPAPAKPAATAKALTDDARAKIAVRKVRMLLKPQTGRMAPPDVRPAVVSFNGDARNPITGAGPIEIYVTQQRAYRPGVWGKLRAFFNPAGKQKYLVNVDANGSAQILDRISLAPQARVLRFFLDRLPIGALAHDMFNSGKLSETVFTTIGATSVAAFSPAVSGALFMRVGQVVRDGIQSQNAVRKTALDNTVAWAKKEGKGSAWPTLMDTYRYYQSDIDSQQEGARPLALGAFANALAVRDL